MNIFNLQIKPQIIFIEDKDNIVYDCVYVPRQLPLNTELGNFVAEKLGVTLQQLKEEGFFTSNISGDVGHFLYKKYTGFIDYVNQSYGHNEKDILKSCYCTHLEREIKKDKILIYVIKDKND